MFYNFFQLQLFDVKFLFSEKKYIFRGQKRTVIIDARP